MFFFFISFTFMLMWNRNENAHHKTQTERKRLSAICCVHKWQIYWSAHFPFLLNMHYLFINLLSTHFSPGCTAYSVVLFTFTQSKPLDRSMETMVSSSRSITPAARSSRRPTDFVSLAGLTNQLMAKQPAIAVSIVSAISDHRFCDCWSSLLLFLAIVSSASATAAATITYSSVAHCTRVFIGGKFFFYFTINLYSALSMI